MPALDLNASYGAQGLGGTRASCARARGIDSQVDSASIPGGYFDALSLLRNRDYPNWNFA